MNTLPAEAILEGICRVCGTPLSPPLVSCSQCATPHHQDCWEYNRGCSIYGCSAAAAPEVLLIEAAMLPEPVEPERSVPVAARIGYAVALGCGGFAVGMLWAVPVATALGLTGIAVSGWVVGALSRPVPEEEAPSDPTFTVGLARKAVTALVGKGEPHQLAQAYALFEQRNPTERLEAGRQQDLALELLDNGYRVIGLEALAKALKTAGEAPELRRRRRRALLADPAFAAEGLGPAEGPSALGEQPFHDHLDIFKQLLRDTPTASACYVLSLSSQGWGDAFQAALTLPSHPALRPSSGIRVNGPHPPDVALGEARARMAAGHPTVLLPIDAAALSDRVQLVLEIQLSQNEARFRTEEGELVFPWDQIANVIVARIDKSEMLREKQPAGGGSHYSQAISSTRIREVVESHVILEIHAGTPTIRLRIERPEPEVFRYLGRRREASLAANTVLTAKDLVRFGPNVRASHGLCDLFSERTGPGSRFPDVDTFEEYAFWFACLGTPALREQWEPLRSQLDPEH